MRSDVRINLSKKFWDQPGNPKCNGAAGLSNLAREGGEVHETTEDDLQGNMESR